jgi:hypothetical protein
MDDHWRLAWGIARSLWIYYRSPGRRRWMNRLYSRFVRSGDLVFDIGAHVGDRTAAFCRSVAVSSPSSLSRPLPGFCVNSTAIAPW